MANILITSTKIDSDTYKPISKNLIHNGHSVIEYNADQVVKGNDNLTISEGKHKDFNFLYNKQKISEYTIHAAWFRHPELHGYNMEDKAKQMLLELEGNEIQKAIWYSLSDSIWLNSPRNMQYANIKLIQLELAKTIGFNIPQTIISSKWEAITSAFKNKKIVVKMSMGLLYENNYAKNLYTTIIDNTKIKDLSKFTQPFPAIFQEYVEKKREWRITIVGKQVFEAAIYTTDEAKDDWRKYQYTSAVKFIKGTIPQDIKNKCLFMLKKYNLKYGAFDFIEDPHGNFVFLELNPNGQFGWLENKLGLPISNAISDELERIAISNGG